MNNNVNIIIPIFNNTQYTTKCIRLISRYATNSYKINVILVDNGSEEKSLHEIEKFCQTKTENINVILLKEPKNIGYTLSVNYGIKYSIEHFPASYTVLMHNDVEVVPNWLDTMIPFIRDNTVGVIPITSDDYIDQGYAHIRQTNFLPNFPESFYRLKTAETTELLRSLYNNMSIEINPQQFNMKMFCIIFNTLIFNKIGLFDPIFIDGFSSDEDFIYRLYKNNYNIKLIPAISVRHDTGTTYRRWEPNWIELKKLKDARHLQYQIVNSLNPDKIKKTVIYTCQFGENKTKINSLSAISEEFDYIYFTDTDDIDIPYPWKKINILKLYKLTKTQEYNSILFEAWIKTHLHLLFRNYKISIFIKNNINIIDAPYKLEQLLQNNQYIFALTNINNITSINKLIELYKLAGKDDLEKLTELQDLYLQNNFVQDDNILNTNLLILEHNNKNCIHLMYKWYNLMKKYTYHDILTCSYCLFKEKININTINSDFIYNKYISNFGK